MTTLRVALDASGMIAQARQVVSATQAMGQAATATGRAMDGLDRNLVQTARAGDATRETLKATSGAIQSAGNVRQLVDALKQVDGGFASIANVAAIAAQTVLSFARAADDFRQMSEATNQFADAMQASATVVQVADDGLGIYGSTATAATTAISAQAAATTTATGATSLFTRATLALRAAWAAHPVLLIGTVLAAAATAMAAFAGNTKKATEETDALAEQQRALEQALKNVQKIRAEAVVGQRFGIAGAADTARQREREAVFQQAVTVEQARLQGGGRIPVSALGAAGTPEDIISSRARLSFQFERQVTERSAAAALRLRETLRGEGTGPLPQLSDAQLAEIRNRITNEVRGGFTVGYDEAINILQGRFDELGDGIKQALEAAQQQVPQPSGVAFGISESMGRVQAQIDAEIARRAVLDQINSALAEENRLAGLTEDAREREVALLRIKQEAASAGVELSQQELANIEATLAARQRQAQIDRQAQFNREVLRPSEEGLYLAQFGQDQREIEAAVMAARAQAESSRTQFSVAQEEQLRANMAAMQQMENLRAVGQEVGSALGGAFVNAATGVATLRQALAALLQDLLRIAAQRAIIAPLANALGGAFSGLGNTPSQQQSNIEARNMTYEPS